MHCSEKAGAGSKAQLVLASSSPRRRALLDQIGVRYTVEPVDVDETEWRDELPEDYVRRMAAAKSERGQILTGRVVPILGADTIVVDGRHILGKPENKDQAVEMLNRLSGRSHQVMSAVSVRTDRHFQILSATRVQFRSLTDREIVAYWDTGEPHDKAGAYAIQGIGAMFVSRIEGSFSGVVGLPLFETSELLMKIGVECSLAKKL